MSRLAETIIGLQRKDDLKASIDDALHAFDAYSADQPDTPGRPEAIRRLLRDGLMQLGYLDGKASA